jgi:hypothetical protein
MGIDLQHPRKPTPQCVVLATKLSRPSEFFTSHITYEDRLRCGSCGLSAVSSICLAIRAASIFDAVEAYPALPSLLLKLPVTSRRRL